VDVHLIEPSPFIRTNERLEMPGNQQHTRMLEAARHPRITLQTHTEVDSISNEFGNCQVRLRQKPRYVDLEKCTACGDCLKVCPVAVPGSGRTAVYLREKAEPGCAVIDKLGIAPCAHACPGGIHVQGYIALIAQERFQEAIDLIREAIPFPGICGRICTHPCEINCRRNEVDNPVSIRLLKRFVSDWESQGAGETVKLKSSQVQGHEQSKRIAVVGAGPAGMTAAHDLSRKGYAVTVFEKLPVIGGMLAVGIPAYRLPRDVISKEYELIANQGVDMRLNTSIGPGGDYSLADLFSDGYASVCLTVGAHKSLSLGIPGENLEGVVQGIDLLKAVNLSQQADETIWHERLQNLLPKGEQTRAAVLGGGNTAMDVARTLRRLGLNDVQIVYRRTRDEMPALEEEIDDTEKEGVRMKLLTAPKSILADQQNRVNAIECLQMELGSADQSGRRRPVPVDGSEFQLELDMVVLAIGQEPDLDFLESETNISIGSDWRIQVDAHTFMTDQPGVFAAGDATTRSQMSAIEAIGMGKKMAQAVDSYVRLGRLEPVAQETEQIPVVQRTFTPEELKPKPPITVPVISLSERLQGFEEVETGFLQQDAVHEAKRCLACGPCSECMACVTACKAEAIQHTQRPNFSDITVNSVVVALDAPTSSGAIPEMPESVITIPPNDLINASAAAAQIQTDYRSVQTRAASLIQPRVSMLDTKIGVYICQCGDNMGGIIQATDLSQTIRRKTPVVHSEPVAYACRQEFADRIYDDIRAHQLEAVILAACSCCASDQVCFSCTFQRVRCKKNLGMYAGPHQIGLPSSLRNSSATHFEFVNIREQCAWVHGHDPEAATQKASMLIQGALAKIQTANPQPAMTINRDRTVLIIGLGQASRVCHDALQSSDVTVIPLTSLSVSLNYSEGYYHLNQNGQNLKSLAVILTPTDPSEAEDIIKLINTGNSTTPVRYRQADMETTRPGLYYCDPSFDPHKNGLAVAARCRSWMGRIQTYPKHESGWADPDRCRMCYTCMDICQTGAPQPINQGAQRHVWIDPAICIGCGACAPSCPSNAIQAAAASETQLLTMLEGMLSLGRTTGGT
jgi:NADPH-dependent glutamate synthase beta subunit-like oxidoreductase